MASSGMLLRNASVAGVGRSDILINDGRISAIGDDPPAAGAEVIDAAGGAALPGLHDHHCHLLAMAAARRSVVCGPPETTTGEQLSAVLRAAHLTGGWVRGVGYHESVAGDLDCHVLDRARSDVPTRVQHRGGSLWVLNSAGLAEVGLDAFAMGEPSGIDRDAEGRPTGRLWRCDAWLRDRLDPAPPPDLGAVSAELAAYGITGVTDATPDLDTGALALLRSPSFRQRLTLLGESDSSAPRKILVSDHSLPSLDALVELVGGCRPRAVAVHCVTRVALVLTVAALRQVGTVRGDRIEHAAVVPPDLVLAMAGLGVTVVTQPSLPGLRGDRYLEDAETDDREYLWPFASLLAAGVPVGCSSDAPYGSPDPWFAIRAATARRTGSGRAVAPLEKVSAGAALRGYLTDPLDPGGPVRQVAVGTCADLLVLDAPLDDVLATPDAGHVRFTLVGGEVIHRG